MGTTFSTRYTATKMQTFLTEAESILTSYAHERYTEAAENVAKSWGAKIRGSGRGGSHNEEMSNVEAAVTAPRQGDFFIRIGWLHGAPRAADGKTTWYVYQDVGYDPFGMIAKGYNASRVPGLFAQLDARDMLERELRAANRDIAQRVSAAGKRSR